MTLAIAVAAALLLLPGAWIAFSRICTPLRPELRLATAVVLSPFALAVELAVCALVGWSFATFLRWIAPLNLLSLLLIWRHRHAFGRATAVWREVAIAAALALPLAVLLIALPLFRQYGWHNMMQLAAIQQIDRLPHLPEEMDAAGLRLNYGWLGHTQLAAIARLMNVSPTLVFPAANLLQFVSMFLFSTAATRRLVHVERSTAAIATAVALLLPGLLDLVWAGVSPEFVSRGELRITPMTSKFLYIDEMVVGLSSFSLVVYTTVRVLTAHSARLLPLLLIGGLACGIEYPLLFPSSVVVVSLLGGTLLLVRWSRPRTALLLFGGLITTTALTFAYVSVLGASAVSPPLQLADRAGVKMHLQQLTLVFGSVALVMLAMQLARRTRVLAMERVVLVGMFAALSGCFVVLVMPRHVEYKFLFAALLVVAPVLAAPLCQIAKGSVLARIGVIAALPLTLCATSIALWQWHIPRPWLAKAVPLDETTVAVHAATAWNGSWMQAVRDLTPVDAVLITDDSDQPVSVFTGRAMYVTLDESDRGTARPGRAGYAMRRDLILEQVKGYSRQEIRERLMLVRQCLAADDTVDAHAILQRLMNLNRPVALHVTQPSTLFEWLRTNQVGRAIYRAGSEAVWLVEPTRGSTEASDDSRRSLGRTQNIGAY